MNRFRFLAALLIPVMGPAPVFAADIQAGSYFMDLVGYDPATGKLTGYIDHQTFPHPDMHQPSVHCSVRFAGQLRDGEATIHATDLRFGDGKMVEGIIKPSADGHTLLLTMNDILCIEDAFPADNRDLNLNQDYVFTPDKNGNLPTKPVYSLTLEKPKPEWKSVAIVSAKRAYFYATPQSPKPTATFIVHYDGAGILDQQPGWLKIEYHDGLHDKYLIGWAHAEDFYPQD